MKGSYKRAEYGEKWILFRLIALLLLLPLLGLLMTLTEEGAWVMALTLLYLIGIYGIPHLVESTRK